MKYVLFSLFFLYHLNAFAEFSADSVQENDDGTIRIVRPHLDDKAKGQSISVHYELSSPYGVCRAFGFEEPIAVYSDNNTPKISVVLNRKGEIDSILSKREAKEKSNTSSSIEEISCQLNQDPKITHTSARAEKIQVLELGKVEIANPTYGFIKGKESPFSELTNLNGLCRLYGFERVSEREVTISNDKSSWTVILNREGRFLKFSDERVRTIEKIVCMNELLFRLNANFYPRAFDKTVLALSEIVKPVYANYLKSTIDSLKAKFPLDSDDRMILIDQAKTSQNERIRLIELRILAPFIDSLSSEWFTEVVKPKYDKQTGDLYSHYRVQSLDSFVKNAPEITLVLQNIVSAIDAIQKDISSPDQVSWLLKVKGRAGVWMSDPNIRKFKDLFFVEVENGNSSMEELRTSHQLQGLVGVLDLCFETLKAMRL